MERRREGGKERRREGGKEGRREGEKEGRVDSFSASLEKEKRLFELGFSDECYCDEVIFQARWASERLHAPGSVTETIVHRKTFTETSSTKPIMFFMVPLYLLRLHLQAITADRLM